MSEQKALGKISSVTIGPGGYQDAMFGVTIVLTSKEGGSTDFWGFWSSRSPDAKWSENHQIIQFGEVMMKLKKLMSVACASDIRELKGKPIEIVWENSVLKSWRILDEVL